MKSIVSRLFKYISIDTQGYESNKCCPSNENERLLAELLQEELNEMGFSDVEVDDQSFLYAKIPSNVEKAVAPIAFFAHLDTYPELPGGKIRPKIIENYDGQDIILNKSKGLIVKTKDYPMMDKFISKDLIFSDGSTILGSDGKAGIAEIMEACLYISNHPEKPHGDIYIVFTPDEELGYSTEYINMDKVPAKYGFTVDSGDLGEINFENFNAAIATVTITGNDMHPGCGKYNLKNSVLLANEYINALPYYETPALTEGYEGYYNVTEIMGSTGKCQITINIRDFDKENYEKRKNRLSEIADFLNGQYGEGTFKVYVEDYYLNMKEIIDQHPSLMEISKSAVKMAGIHPTIRPIRGGTDGVTISFLGVPCPNISCGSQNVQSVNEFIAVEDMEKTVEILLNIVDLVYQE